MKNNSLSNLRSNTVAANLLSTREHRKQVALRFYTSLKAILGDATDSIRESLIGAAVSAHVEVTIIITEQFLRARASKRSLTRLSLARGSLIRSLRALGLITSTAEPEEATPPAPLGLSLDEVTRDIIAKRRTAESEPADDMATTSAQHN